MTIRISLLPLSFSVKLPTSACTEDVGDGGCCSGSAAAGRGWALEVVLGRPLPVRREVALCKLS